MPGILIRLAIKTSVMSYEAAIITLLSALGGLALAILGWAASSMRDISKDVGDVKILMTGYFEEFKAHKERTREKFVEQEERIKELSNGRVKH